MKYLQILMVAIIALIGVYQYTTQSKTHSHERHQVVDQPHAAWPEVVTYAKEHLPQEGVLKIDKDGFVYLKVDDNYIRELFPKLGLSREGYREPPNFRTDKAPGAHISVFYVDEHVKPDEIGQTFPFELKDITIVHPTRYTSYAVLQVESPALEKLREKYGVDSKLHGHEFHISLAKKSLNQHRVYEHNSHYRHNGYHRPLRMHH